MSNYTNLNTLKYYIINKPYGVLPQFTDKDGRKTLGDFYNFPRDVYPVGRLDKDSEGLLILTNDKKLTDSLLNPLNKHEREYYVQVEGTPTDEALQQLRDGVVIENKITLPAKAKIISPPEIWKRIPPIRVRKLIPDTWISLILTEGRNRQVRKMTAIIGNPTLRLVRIRIKSILLKGLKPGEVRELTADEIAGLKKL
jgi:23S rRNA pseudouridine2457 synthase